MIRSKLRAFNEIISLRGRAVTIPVRPRDVSIARRRPAKDSRVSEDLARRGGEKYSAEFPDKVNSAAGNFRIFIIRRKGGVAAPFLSGSVEWIVN